MKKLLFALIIIPITCFGYGRLNRWGCRVEGRKYQCYENADTLKPVVSVNMKALQIARERRRDDSRYRFKNGSGYRQLYRRGIARRKRN